MSTRSEIDEATGVETTGHVWDGDLKELNKPLPKWWLYTFYVSIVWAIGYWIAYPAWPTMNDYTRGLLGYSARTEVSRRIAEGQAAHEENRKQLSQTPLAEVRTKPDLLRYATASGAAAFATNCAPCHGRGAQGFPGYPNLNDDEWIWGGGVDDIHHTIRYGIRAGHKETRQSQMPRFGVDNILTKDQISDVAEFVLSLSRASEDAVAIQRGAVTFAEQCAVCHGENGAGNSELGAPNLSNAIWLYGDRKADIVRSIETGRGGMMPSWAGRLDETTIKSLAIYVQSLGGAK
jgi:cytochrome c oxidase cbb3-type subunit III